MKRVRVLESWIEGLGGVGDDTRAFQAVLEACNFEIIRRPPGRPVHPGIIAGYRELAPDMTAVARAPIEPARTLRARRRAPAPVPLLAGGDQRPGQPPGRRAEVPEDRRTDPPAIEDATRQAARRAPSPVEGEPASSIADSAGLHAIRELEGEHGVLRGELEIEFGTVEAGAPRPLRDHCPALGLRDRFYIQIKNRGRRPLFVHVFNVGLHGELTLLTGTAAPSGITLRAGDPPFVLGKTADGALRGLGIAWPQGMPRAGFPCLDEYFVVVTSSRVQLATAAGSAERDGGTGLRDLLAQLKNAGAREGRGDPRGYFVQRLSYLRYPRDAAMAGLAFEIDENPSGQAPMRAAGAWFAHGSDAFASAAIQPASVPDAIAIRLVDLVVARNRPVLSEDLRIDALICTRGEGRPGHATWTRKYAGITPGQRLPLGDGLLYRGHVRDFVDLALFASRDAAGSPELSRLLAERADSPDFKNATAALLVGADAMTAPWINAVGASAVLARVAYELVLGIAGKSIGLYRTSFLRRERFGLGRHPAEQRYRTRDFAFSLAIEPVQA